MDGATGISFSSRPGTGTSPHASSGANRLSRSGADGQGMFKPGYDPMSLIPGRPASCSGTLSRMEREYGVAPLEEALRAPVEGRRALATAVR